MMSAATQSCFGPFCLDVEGGCLWHNTERLPLRPKTFAVLAHLVAHAGQLVTKQALLDAVWPKTTVSDAVLKACLHEIRQTLGDTVKSPQFVSTVHRRGYRFIAPVTQPAPSSRQPDAIKPPSDIPIRSFPTALSEMPPSLPLHASLSLIGRDAVLQQLHENLTNVLQGHLQVVFVTGEAGIGKTAVLEHFMAQAAAIPGLAITLGQCVEQHGSGEAYGPVLEALGQLCRGPHHERVIEVLRHRAPTWLVQMPWLLQDTDRETLQRELLGATRERMLRELAEALELLTVDMPLLIILEDLHWSDYATLDLITVLAQRREPMQLLLLSTYRPVEVILQNHPLREVKQNLQVHNRCRELPLELLNEEAVASLLNARFPGSHLPRDLIHLIYQRTDGNPLFLVNVAETLATRNFLGQHDGEWKLQVALETVEVEVPESLRQMIEQQFRRLTPPEQQVLETASVVGRIFAAATVATSLEDDVESVEQCCERLVHQQHMLRPATMLVWPDGTITARYEFQHWMYQHVAYENISVSRRVRLHRSVGLYEEAVYNSRAHEIAAELAVHFTRGRDAPRTLQYLQQAADNAAQRYANREAIEHLSQALRVVEQLPSDTRLSHQLTLHEKRGMVYRMMGDMQAAARDFVALADYAHAANQLETVVSARFYQAGVLSWLNRDQCLETVEQAVALSQTLPDSELHLRTQGWAGYWNLLWRGWQDRDALACADAVTAVRRSGDPTDLGPHIGRYTYFQSLQSAYHAAGETAREGVDLASEAGDASEYLLCHFFWAWALLHQGEWGHLQRVLNDGRQMAEKNGHHRWAMLLRLEMAWLCEEAGDFNQAQQLAHQSLIQADEAQLGYGQMVSTILLGRAYLSLGETEQAWHYFSAITRRLKHERILMDWIWRMPLHLSLSAYWLSQHDYTQAEREAHTVCNIAKKPGEVTYLAQAYGLLAEIAMAQQQWQPAATALAQARTSLETADAPLAAWRVYATASQFALQTHSPTEASDYGRQSAAVLNRFTHSLAPHDPLRQTLSALPHDHTIMELIAND